MIVLVDMDEVLADFAGAAIRVHGWTRAELEAVWPPGTWSIVEPLGLTLGQFWAGIERQGEAFWTGLEPLPWMHDLVGVLEASGLSWYVCSSPSLDPASYSGKVKWLQNHLSVGAAWFNRLILTNHKHLLAGPDKLLIDDNEASCDKFVQCGGEVILFPSRHNRLHTLASNPVQHVAERLGAITLV